MKNIKYLLIILALAFVFSNESGMVFAKKKSRESHLPLLTLAMTTFTFENDDDNTTTQSTTTSSTSTTTPSTTASSTTTPVVVPTTNTPTSNPPPSSTSTNTTTSSSTTAGTTTTPPKPSTPSLVMSTNAGNTALASGFLPVNYYASSAFSTAATRSLTIVGIAAALLGIAFLLINRRVVSRAH